MPRSAADYAAAIWGLLPTGRIWQALLSSNQRATVLALAQEPARVDAAATTLLEQSLPGSNLDLLTEWETTLGLPDPCAGADAAIADRARQVAARFLGGGGQSAAFFTAFAAAMGFVIEIVLFAPLRVEVGTVETPLFEDAWLFTWGVHVAANSSGLSNDVLLCELNSLKPAHTTVFLV